MKWGSAFVGLLMAVLVFTSPVGESLAIGGHAWGSVDELWVRSSDNCIISVPVTSQLEVTYADLRTRCEFVGPAEANYDRYVAQVERAGAEGATIGAYVPELVPQTPPGESGVPIVEGEELEVYLQAAINETYANNLKIVYGPATALLKVDPDQRWGELWNLDLARITELASMMPDDGLWLIRAFNMEVACGQDQACFTNAVVEYIDAVHAGNPNVDVHVHLKLPPDEVDEFLMRKGWLESGTNAASVYAGIGPQSTGEELLAVLD